MRESAYGYNAWGWVSLVGNRDDVGSMSSSRGCQSLMQKHRVYALTDAAGFVTILARRRGTGAGKVRA